MSNEETKPDTTTTTTTSSASSSSTPRPPRPRPAAPPPPLDPAPGTSADPREAALEAKRKKREAAAGEARQKHDESLKEYLYTGPSSFVTLGNGDEVHLAAGTVVKLPSEAKFTKNLLDRKYATDDEALIKAARGTETEA